MRCSLGAHPGESWQDAVIHRLSETVGTGAIGDENDDRHAEI